MVEYDPIKERMSGIVKNSVLLRKMMFTVLNLLFLRTWYVRRAVKRLHLKENENLNILDAGSGFGQYTYYLAKKFKMAKVIGVELKQEHVNDSLIFAEKAKVKNLSFIRDDLITFKSRDKYDLIISVDVLEHIEDDRSLMHRFSDLLKPGGFLIISTPSLLRNHTHDGSFVGEHFREGYTREDIEEKLNDAGLKIKKFEYSYGVFGDISWRIGIRNTMRLMAKGAAGRAAGVLYLGIVLLPVLILMVLDYCIRNRQGTGIVVTAVK